MHFNGTTKQKTFEDYAIQRAQKCYLKSSKEIGELKKLLSNMTYISYQFKVTFICHGKG